MKRQLQKQIITGLAFIFCLTNTFGQTSTKEITDKFFSIYSRDPIKAVEYAFSTNKWFEKKQEGVDNLKTKLKNTIDICGDYYGYEMLSEKTAGQSISLVTFIVKYDREPLRFTFFFYKANDTWRVNNFSYDDNISDELEEAAKIYRLKENNLW